MRDQELIHLYFVMSCTLTFVEKSKTQEGPFILAYSKEEPISLFFSAPKVKFSLFIHLIN